MNKRYVGVGGLGLGVLFALAGCTGNVSDGGVGSGEGTDSALSSGNTRTKTGSISGTRRREYDIYTRDEGTLVLRLAWTNASANLDLRLYDDEGTRVAVSEGTTGTSEEIRFPVGEDEEYTVQVRGIRGSTSYSLSIALDADTTQPPPVDPDGGAVQPPPTETDAGMPLPPAPACGDKTCNGSETCSTCAADCGVCPTQPPPTGNGTYWKPTNTAPIHWHWQLSDDFSYPRDVVSGARVYDIDGEKATKADVAALHALGPDVKVICYFDAGVYEDYRSDQAMFPKSVIGPKDVGWDGSYWLDIRKLDIIMPILKHRMQDWCVAKGFDAIEPDETEVYGNAKNYVWPDGGKMTLADNNAFNKAVADMAHSLNLSVGLKGNNTEAGILEPYFDWALSEECYQYEECDFFKNSFAKKGKAVFIIEYEREPDCTDANAAHMNAARRDLDVLGPTSKGYLYHPCIPNTQDHW